eukprot:6338798-Lingulodinium_polyedra.AAC.1
MARNRASRGKPTGKTRLGELRCKRCKNPRALTFRNELIIHALLIRFALFCRPGRGQWRRGGGRSLARL